jgi:hypothetical protein
MKVDQHTVTEDFRGPLDQIASQLLPDVTKPSLANRPSIDLKGVGAEART